MGQGVRFSQFPGSSLSGLGVAGCWMLSEGYSTAIKSEIGEANDRHYCNFSGLALTINKATMAQKNILPVRRDPDTILSSIGFGRTAGLYCKFAQRFQ